MVRSFSAVAARRPSGERNRMAQVQVVIVADRGHVAFKRQIEQVRSFGVGQQDAARIRTEAGQVNA